MSRRTLPPRLAVTQQPLRGSRGGSRRSRSLSGTSPPLLRVCALGAPGGCCPRARLSLPPARCGPSPCAPAP
eukprot:9414556-Lingulodinium_polyedra.AAC.1